MSHSHQHAIESNIAAFNTEVVEEYDQRESTIKLSKVIPHILLNYPQTSFNDDDLQLPPKSQVFTEEKSLLDFACGTGLVTQYFKPYVKDIKGIDISSAALKVFEQRVSNGYELDILDPHKQQEIQSFYESADLIICSIAYHHLDNYVDITKILAKFLKPSGKLFIIDFYNPDIEVAGDDRIGHSEAVRHMGGLKKSSLTNTLESAGLSNITVDEVINTEIWQHKDFITTHCQHEIIQQLSKDTLPKKEVNGKPVYLISSSLVLAVGEK